ncbi:MAG: DJ-1/PfpI family protein [Gammaproteobacteria bacterium]
MNRRSFTKYMLLAGSLSPLIQTTASASQTIEQRKAQARKSSDYAHQAMMTNEHVKMMGNEKIAMLLYPGFYAPDLINPLFVFNALMGSEIYLVSPNDALSPVEASGVSIMPTHKQCECPDDLDILFVPGGATGTLKAMKNKPFIDFIRTKAATSKYITSVCTGSLLLGKAGLLKGKKATSHWSTLHLLQKFDATPISERVVWDGNLVTGGGVTAGIDFGLEMAAALRGKEYGEAIQLQAEYDPMPPFESGSPATAPVFVRDNVKAMFAPLVLDMKLAI